LCKTHMVTLFLLGTTTALVGPLHRPPLLASPGLAPRGCCVRACAAPAEPSLLRRGASLGGIVLADALLKRGFVRRGVAFPSSLAGSVMLFASLCSLRAISPPLARGVARAARPGCAIIAKWLPLFFVPNLVLLPLVLRIGAGDAARLALLIGGGAVLSLPACGFAARTALAASESLPERQRLSERLNVGMYEPPASDRVASAAAAAAAEAASPVTGVGLFADGDEDADASESVAAANAPPRPPFAAALLPRLASAALASGAASALAAQGLGAPAAAEWLRDASLLTTTAGGFVAGSTLVPKRAQKLLHPLLTCTLCTHAAVAALALATAQPFSVLLRSYLLPGGAPLAAPGSIRRREEGDGASLTVRWREQATCCSRCSDRRRSRLASPCTRSAASSPLRCQPSPPPPPSPPPEDSSGRRRRRERSGSTRRCGRLRSRGR